MLRHCLSALVLFSLSALAWTEPLSMPQPASVYLPPAGKGLIDQSDPELPPGYVEEEFLVSGLGRVFAYDAQGEAEVLEPDVSWTTRVLVRRPGDQRRISGWAFIEPLHPELGTSFAWRQSKDYFAREGDVWIGITTSRNLILYGAGDPLTKLRKADPVRYGGLHFGLESHEGGLNWDIISSVGQLAKSGLLSAGVEVRKSVLGGWSGAGAVTLLYANTFHRRVRAPDGGPIFDAVLLGEPGWYPRINSNSPDIMPYDIRQRPANLDVPVISLNSSAPIHFAMPFRPRPDSDELHSRFRSYEIAGADHRGARSPMDGDLSSVCSAIQSTFPLHHYYSLAIDHLKRWSDSNSAPPASRYIEIDTFGQVRLDTHGNPKGGIRSPALEVPIARYFQTHDARQVRCRGGGRMEFFSREKLTDLYGNHAAYVDRVRESAQALVQQGWLLAQDGDVVIREAEAFRGFE